MRDKKCEFPQVGAHGVTRIKPCALGVELFVMFRILSRFQIINAANVALGSWIRSCS